MSESLFRRSRRELPPELEAERQRIEALARQQGLDFFETIFEMCDYDEINMIASYGGFPVRYPHWRWGMDFLQMDKNYEYGLQKIYEMVINTNPSYAYLLDNNTLMDQKLVMAHVFGHVDFFKNNQWFSKTNRKMLDQMANHAVKVRRIIDVQGQDAVEQWLDVCLSVENLIDPYLYHTGTPSTPVESPRVHKMPSKDYMDAYINPPEYLQAQARKITEEAQKARNFPESPVRDVLGFLLEHGRMEPWQGELLNIIRDEAYYFVPQAQTKIMNEGWASYWHTHLMTHSLLTDAEVIDYADHHSGTVAMRPGQLNPYKIGLELWRDIEDRWNTGRFGKEWLDCDDYVTRRDWNRPTGLGRAKIFEVRRFHNDVTFIDEFLTDDVCRRVGLFTYGFDRKSGEYVVDSREFAEIKKKLLFMLSNHGQPRVVVSNGNYGNRGELELSHLHEEVDLQIQWATTVLGNLAKIWGRPVHLQSRVEGRPAVLHHDGEKFSYDGPKITAKK